MGVIVQKKDGGFLYTTTDIAAAKYRYETLKADRALVFSDTRQKPTHATSVVNYA